MLVRRSTFPGAGRFTAHWTGDNGVNWENLYMSIAGEHSSLKVAQLFPLCLQTNCMVC